MSAVNRDAMSWPRPGLTGWRDRIEGPLWVDDRRRRSARLVPYCVLQWAGGLNPYAPPCRLFADFPCCQRPWRGRRPGLWPWR